MAARFAYTISRGWIERVTGMPWRKVWFVIFGSLLVSLLLVAPASADVLDKVGQSIAGFVASLFLQVASLLVGVMAFFVSLLINVASYSDFINMPGVMVGWTLVRDIANMFFVVILLIIAFGTILGYEQYHYKKLLPRFVGAAVLINFSRLIVGLIIDAAQVIMMTFVNAISQVGGGNFIQVFQINNAWKVAQGSPPGSGLEQIVTAMFVMILVFIAAVLIGMFALLLVLRMVTLWVLVVLSPLAALLYTVPAGDFKKYYDEWWSKFKANVFLGPVVAFFLWLALTMAGDGTSLYAKIKEKGGGKADFTEAGTAAKGITGSAISSIENLSSFVIAAAIFAIAFDMAKKMSAQAGMPGAGAITKAAGGLIKGGIGEMTGYSFAGRAVAPAWKQMKEISAKTAPGTGIGKGLERGVLAAGAMAPGAAGKEAKERLNAARWDDTQKAQQKLKRQTNEELDKKITLGTGAESRAAALELTSRGQRLTPEQMKLVAQEMEKDPKAFDQLKQSMKRSMPELAYDLSDAAQRKALLKDPDVKHENLGVRAFTNAGGLVTNDGRALVGELLAEKGSKGFTKFVEDMKDPKAQEVVLKVMREELIPQRVAATEASKARLEGPGGVKEQLAARQRDLATNEARGEQTWPAQQERYNLTTNIQQLMKEKDTLESDVKAGAAMVEAHTKETGRPDQAVEHIADPTLRRKEMEVVLKKVKLSDLKDDALKNIEVIAGMQGAFGSRVGDAVKLMNPDKREVVMGALNTMDVATAPQEAVEVRIQLTGKLDGNPPLIAIQKAVESVDARQLGALDMNGVGPAGVDAILEGLLKNLPTFRSAPANREANPLTLKRLKRAVLATADPRYLSLREAVDVPGKSNKWNDVDASV